MGDIDGGRVVIGITFTATTTSATEGSVCSPF